jgi:hypothetical protein
MRVIARRFGYNTPLLAVFGNAEIVGLKWLSLRTELSSWAGACDSNEVAILSAGGGQVSFVNRARPTKKPDTPLLVAGWFIHGIVFEKQLRVRNEHGIGNHGQDAHATNGDVIP